MPFEGIYTNLHGVRLKKEITGEGEGEGEGEEGGGDRKDYSAWF
ncbi:MAG: hypothetical protein JWR10_866 [Rubritepida sp.]|nr:hypothetical protein [Rubritepida sp.]